MTDPAASILERADSVVQILESVPLGAGEYRSLDEATLLRLNQVAARARELATALGAAVAGEIARRSSPEFGSAGLAQRTGFRTPEEFIKSSTRSTSREAVTAVRVGRLIAETHGRLDPGTGELRPPAEPWLAPATSALTEGDISVASVDAIRSGIGVPSSAVTTEQLRDAVASLITDAAVVDPDRLYKRARALRDEIDITGVALREEERRSQRSLRVTVLPSGMGRLVWTMHPETLATVKDLYDRATSPKLGGVRFVAENSAQKFRNIIDDPRTPEQLASDGFEQLLRLGADTDPRFLIGSGAPVVTVTVTKTAHDSGTGFARVEGQVDPIGPSTVQRLACDGRVIELTFDDRGHPLDLGREQRLFTKRQRLALAVRDGGCRAPGCDRPPSWTETHHVKHWNRDHGATDIANGILLCKHHHLLFHNNGWDIETDDQARYWLIPPATIDPTRTRQPMPTKSLAIADLKRTATG
jgi:hypothetical protein